MTVQSFMVDDNKFDKKYYQRTATTIFPKKSKSHRSYRHNPDEYLTPDTGCAIATEYLGGEQSRCQKCPFTQCEHDCMAKKRVKEQLANWMMIPNY